MARCHNSQLVLSECLSYIMSNFSVPYILSICIIGKKTIYVRVYIPAGLFGVADVSLLPKKTTKFLNAYHLSPRMMKRVHKRLRRTGLMDYKAFGHFLCVC